MHIVHIGKYYSPAVGGMETLVRDQARAQAEAGHRVDVVVVNHQGSSGKNLSGLSFGFAPSTSDQDGDIRVHRVNRLGSLSKCDMSTSFSTTIRKLAESKPDIWHLHTPNATAVVGLQRNLAHCRPLVVSHHGDILNQRLLRPFYEFLEHRIYGNAALLISDSVKYIAGSRQLQRHREKITVLPIGIELDPFQNPCPMVMDISRQWKQRFGEPLWLCVGRLVPYKAFQIAIRALAHVSGNLLIIGVGPEESSLKGLASRMGVADRVNFLGGASFDQLRAAYRAATALWFTSNHRSEGFGIVQVEAMASGCPVINTDLAGSGVSEVSIHNQTGFTVSCDDPTALADAARKLVDDAGLRDRFSLAASTRAAEFDKKRLNARCLELYQQACFRLNDKTNVRKN